MTKKRKLRPLAVAANATTERSKYYWLIMISLFGVFLSSTYLLLHDGRLVNDFKRLSLTQYQIYVYGRSDYCDSNFDTRRVADGLRETIYGQDDVLVALDAALNLDVNTTSIALIGPQGVGKSLTLHTIQDLFPWHYNVQPMKWEHTDSQQSNLYRLKDAFKYMTTCGRNGIFIDNIRPTDWKEMAEFDADLRRYCVEHDIKVLAFYVFNRGRKDLAKSNEPGEETKNSNSYQPINIPEVNSIYFRTFDKTDLRECILREAARLDIILTAGDVTELVSNVDVTSTGLKTVTAKVSRYAHVTS